jgi:uncharacterized protein (TIGR03000 family)
MRLPANAEVWFSGEKTKSTGERRSFMTPSLDNDRKYAYEVRIRWTDRNGEEREKVEKVRVRPGDRLQLRIQ